MKDACRKAIGWPEQQIEVKNRKIQENNSKKIDAYIKGK